MIWLKSSRNFQVRWTSETGGLEVRHFSGDEWKKAEDLVKELKENKMKDVQFIRTTVEYAKL